MVADSSADKFQLQLTSREWATKVCCIINLIVNLGRKIVVQQVRSNGRGLDLDLANEKIDYSVIDKQVGLFTECTIRLKDSVSYTLDRLVFRIKLYLVRVLFSAICMLIICQENVYFLLTWKYVA